MHKLIFIFILSFIKLFAYEVLDISQASTLKNLNSYQYCTADINSSFSFDDIVDNNDLQKIKKSNLGYLQQPYWCKSYIINSSKEDRSIILSNPRPGMDHIDVLVYEDKKIKERFTLGDMVSLKNRSYPSVFSNFELKLKAGQQSIIVTKYQSVGNIEVSWIVHDFQSFMQDESLNFILIFSMFGFFFAMMVYKIFIYFHIKDKEYLVYALALGTNIISQGSLQGSLHYFLYDSIDLFTITLFCWNMSHLFLVFLWIFTLYFFNITKSSRFYYPLLLVIYYNIFVTIFYSLAYIWIDVLKFTNIIATIAFFESILLLLFSFVMLYQRKAGSGYFLVGHILYIVSIFFYILNLKGEVEFSILNHHSTAIGVFLVVLFMSLALSKKFKAIKEENKRVQEQLEKNKQFTMIGTTISYVVHQWKQPLSILASQTSNLLAKVDHEPDIKISQLENNLLNLEKSVLFINDTLTSIKTIFSTNEAKHKTFRLKDTYNTIKKHLNFEKYNILLQESIDNDIVLDGNENLFFHAITNILQNAIEAFETIYTKNKLINIICTQEKDKIVLTIEDNAGGIKLQNINDEFNPAITTKKDGTGIGLAFTKNIIESKFKGTIDVKNKDNGTLFQINFNKM